MAPTMTAQPDADDVTAVLSSKSLSSLPTYPTFASKQDERVFLKFRLAQAFRIFGNLGYDEGVAGHVTVRDPVKPDCFWVNPFGLHFSLIQPSDLLLVNHDGDILDESGPLRLMNTAAFMIHSAIHAARPDVICAAHSHSTYGKAFSVLGRELDMITTDSCQFYNDHAVYKQFNGVVLDAEEGSSIVSALGSRKAVILQNHGLLVATNTIEATTFFYSALEKCCHVQLLADAAAAGRGGETVKIPPDEAYKTYKVIGSPAVGYLNAQPVFQYLEAKEGVKFTGKV